MFSAVILLWAFALMLTSFGRAVAEDEAKLPVVRIGHVGHDHQIALYCAALEGEKYKDCGVWMKELKAKEVYNLMEGDKPVAELHLLKVGGASDMPAAMQRGEMEIGLGGIAAVAVFIDKGAPLKIVCPLQTQGDMLVVKPDMAVTDWKSFVEYVKKSDKPIKIGYKGPDAVAKFILVAACKEEGILFHASEGESTTEAGKTGTVELVNLIDGKNMVPSLASGAVDGFVMNQPQVSLAVIKKVGKVVADLSDLPPTGMWKDHPCCCIAVNTNFAAGNRGVLKLLLKLVWHSTEKINADKTHAAKLAAQWTKLDEAVELDSVPTIAYLAEFTQSWKDGMVTWGKTMNDLGSFTGKLKGLEKDKFLAEICDFALLDEVVKECKPAPKEEEKPKE